jgi:AcrR family transcriptional regulator
MPTHLMRNQVLRRRKQSRKRRKDPLSIRDWVEAATDSLIDNNVNSIEVSNLCRRLGVTKGSFYWHFDALRDLLDAILDDWQKRMTTDVSLRAQRAGNTVDIALRHLLSLIRKPRPNRNSAIERSVREWARTDPIVRTAVIEVDQKRLAFFEGLFRGGSFSDTEARTRAYAAYAMMMGDSILKETIDFAYPAEDYVKTVVQLLLGQVEARGAGEIKDRSRLRYKADSA